MKSAFPATAAPLAGRRAHSRRSAADASGAPKDTTVADPATLEDLGDPVTDTWFQEDAEPIAVRVDVGHADWWDAPGRLRQALSLAGAKVSGSQPDMGERGTADP